MILGKKKSSSFLSDAKKKKKKKKKNKTSQVALYDFLVVDIWDEDPSSQISVYQDVMYNRNYRKWKKKKHRMKSWEMKVRGNPAKYYKRGKNDPPFNSSKMKKSEMYKMYKSYHKKKGKKGKKGKKKKHYVENESSGIFSIVFEIIDIACDTGIIEAIFGKKAKHGVKFVESVLQIFV